MGRAMVHSSLTTLLLATMIAAGCNGENSDTSESVKTIRTYFGEYWIASGSYETLFGAQTRATTTNESQKINARITLYPVGIITIETDTAVQLSASIAPDGTFDSAVEYSYFSLGGYGSPGEGFYASGAFDFTIGNQRFTGTYNDQQISGTVTSETTSDSSYGNVKLTSVARFEATL